MKPKCSTSVKVNPPFKVLFHSEKLRELRLLPLPEVRHYTVHQRSEVIYPPIHKRNLSISFAF